MVESSLNLNHQRQLSFIRVYTQLSWRSEIFPLFKQVGSLGFLCSTLRRFCSVFLFDFLKWYLTLCQIYWIPIYNSWNWFVLWWRTHGSKNMQISDFFCKDGCVYLIEDNDVRKQFKYCLSSGHLTDPNFLAPNRRPYNILLLLLPYFWKYLLATCSGIFSFFFFNLFLCTAFFVISVLFYLNLRHFNYELIGYFQDHAQCVISTVLAGHRP